MKNECVICGNKDNNKVYKVRERLLNQGDVFDYLYCDKCGTLQLIDKPYDMSKYYGDKYYSFGLTSKTSSSPSKVKSVIATIVTKSRIKLPYLLQAYIKPKAGSIMMLYGTGINKNACILDIGGVMESGYIG